MARFDISTADVFRDGNGRLVRRTVRVRTTTSTSYTLIVEETFPRWWRETWWPFRAGA